MNPEKTTVLNRIAAISRAAKDNQTVHRELNQLIDGLADLGWQRDALEATREKTRG